MATSKPQKPSTRRPELGKWLLWRLFHSSAALRPFLPETAKLSLPTLREFTSRYPSLYLKPVAGARGRGVMRLWQTPKGSVFLQLENHPAREFPSLMEAYRHCRTATNERSYIIQRDVGLLSVQGRPFDVRVMMQRDGRREWQCTAIAAKIAGPGSAITNIARSHGRVVSLDHALRAAAPRRAAEHAAIARQLRELGMLTVRQLETYQLYAEVGVDAGVDRHLRIWMLEANTGPSHRLFQHMDDASLYERVQRTARERRRTSRRDKPLH